MQRNQGWFALKAFTVWRVADHCAYRAFRQWVGQFADVIHVKGDQFSHASAAGVPLRHFNDAAIDIRTKEA
ncbi:hypothetical protein D3C77_704270 [compost metagenome]